MGILNYLSDKYSTTEYDVKAVKPNEDPLTSYVGFWSSSPAPVISPEIAMQGTTGICINYRATQVANREIIITTEDVYGEYSELPKEDPISKLFTNPNPEQTIESMMSGISKYLDIHGNSFVYLNRGGGSVPLTMWLIPTEYVTVKSNIDVTKTEYQVLGFKETIKFIDMIHFKRFVPTSNPMSDFKFGISPEMVAALPAMTTSNAYETFIQELFARGGSSPTMFNVKSDFTGEVGTEIESIRKNAKESLPEGSSFGIFSNVELLALNSQSTSVSTTDVSEQAQKDIYSAFGLGKDYIEKNKSSLAGSVTTTTDIQQNTIFPIIESILSTFQSKLRFYIPTITFTFDTKIDVGPTAQLDRDKLEWEGGIINKNEYRVRRGLIPVVDGTGEDTFFTMEGSVSTEQDGDIKSLNFTFPDEEYKTSYWKAGYTKAQASVVEIQDAMVKYDEGLQLRVKNHSVAYVAEAFKSVKAATLLEPFDLEYESKIAVTETDESRLKAGESSGTGAILSINVNIGDSANTGLDKARYDGIIRTSVDESAKKIKMGVETMHKELSILLKNTVTDNPTFSKIQLQQALDNAVDNKFNAIYKKSRAATIAQTTTTSLRATVQRNIFTDLGYDYKWLTTRDAKVRDPHRSLDGKAPDKEGLFHNSLGSGYGPGDMDSAKNSANCHCQLLPYEPQSGKMVIGKLEI